MHLGQRRISAYDSCYVIAEIGVNHNGSPTAAHTMIDAAKEAGADAVKFQTFSAGDLVSASAPKASYQTATTGSGTQISMLRELELADEVYGELREHCREAGIDFMSTAFDARSLDKVLELKPICLKWPSGEINNLPLMRQAASSGLPILLSTGTGSLSEIAMALDWLDEHGCGSVAILQCVSSYPARIEDQNLRAISTMSQVFGRPVGFSDHTIGPHAALAARALGMSVLEKHFTLNRNAEGPDHFASIQPKDFADMVQALRAVEIGLGDGVKRRLPVEEDVYAVARKSLHFASDLTAGHRLRETDVAIKRPGLGIPPTEYDKVIGRILTRNVQRDSPISFDDL